MPMVSYKDFCIDANDSRLMGDFWAGILGLTAHHYEDGDAKLSGPTERHTVWINTVPEPKTVKQRVHLDVWLADVADAERRGARVLRTLPRWTVMADPEGGELCVFTSDPVLRSPRHLELNIDTGEDSAGLARWWADAFGADLHHDEDGWSMVSGIPDCPFEAIIFETMPEPKTVKNRIHLDVYGDVRGLVRAGATVLAELEHWTVMADPQGNEFCVFGRPASEQ